MGFLSRLFSKPVLVSPPSKPKVLIEPDLLPSARMSRVILHWTGGSYVASSLDKEHYHFVIDGDLKILRGLHSIKDNEVVKGKSSDEYAAHTLNANTGSIGISICASAGAVEQPFQPGNFPVKEAQWQLAAEAVAVLCKRYGIPVTLSTVLTHAEVQTNLGIKQNGKWDIAKLTFGKDLSTAKACGDDFRRRVRNAMESM